MMFPFNDDFLKFFLPILDDEREMGMLELEEEDLLFDDLGLEDSSDDDPSEDLWIG